MAGGQTISAPSMIALMLEVSDLKFGTKTLEIGAGSCYNAALIAEICGEKYCHNRTNSRSLSICINNLKNAGYTIKVVLGDGTKGYQKVHHMIE